MIKPVLATGIDGTVIANGTTSPAASLTAPGTGAGWSGATHLERDIVEPSTAPARRVRHAHRGDPDG